MQQYIIAHQQWTIELFNITNLEKKNRKRLENTNDPYSGPSTPSYRYDKLNEKLTSLVKNITCRDTF